MGEEPVRHLEIAALDDPAGDPLGGRRLEGQVEPRMFCHAVRQTVEGSAQHGRAGDAHAFGAMGQARHDAVDAVIASCDAVIHLAAMPGLTKSWADVDLYSSCNIVGTARVLEACERQGTSRLDTDW